jgi:hypothetical protein
MILPIFQHTTVLIRPAADPPLRVCRVMALRT